MDAAVQVREVVKNYRTVRAVERLSFEVRPGEIFALLGPNGAGKTTMVRMLVGIIQPDEGEITFPAGSRRGPLGYLPEERGLHRDTPILRTLEYFGVLNGLERSQARDTALAGLKRFGLDGRERDRVDSLSKGNQQKIQFLAATLHRPSVAVLDEPFSGLDPVNQQQFLAEIRQLQSEGCTVILSAHQMDLVESIADRLLVMDHGVSVLHGTLDEIRSATGSGVHLRLKVGGDAASAAEAIRDWDGLESAAASDTDTLEVRLRRNCPVGDALRVLVERTEVQSIETAEETLREIFVRTVGKGSER